MAEPNGPKLRTTQEQRSMATVVAGVVLVSDLIAYIDTRLARVREPEAENPSLVDQYTLLDTVERELRTLRAERVLERMKEGRDGER